MDPVAHTLVGASLAATGLKRMSRFGTATLLVGANLPDVDALTYALGSDVALLMRRGWTHGVVAMVTLPLALAGAMILFGRLARRGPGGAPRPVHPASLLLLALISVWSHPALDLLNTYGVRLLMPFDGRWFYGDTLFIVDPWFWLLAGAGAVAARRQGRMTAVAWGALGLLTTAFVVLSPVTTPGAKAVWIAGVAAAALASTRSEVRQSAPWVAVACLGALLAYVGAMRAGSIVARERARDWLSLRGVTPVTLMAGPLPADPWRRDVIVGLSDRYEFLVVDLWDGRISPSSHPLARGGHHPAIAAALAAPGVRGFRTWQRYPSYTVLDEPRGRRVLMRDVRYSREGERGFGVAEVLLADE